MDSNIFLTLVGIMIYSVPEEIFLVLNTLFFSKRINLLFERHGKLKVAIPVVTVAVLSTILRKSGVDINVVALLSIFTLFFSVVFTCKALSSGEISIPRVFLSSMGSMILLQIFELYIPAGLWFMGKSLDDLKESILLSFNMSLLERIMEGMYLWFVLVKYKDKLQNVDVSIVKAVIDNTHRFRAFVGICSFSFIYICMVSSLFYFKHILEGMSFVEQIGYFIVLMAVPVIMIFQNLYSAYVSYKNELLESAKNDLLIDSLKYDIVENEGKKIRP